MLKIKKIHFDKTLFDVSPTHHVFSVASVHFTNADPIHGALLYWQENATDGDYTDEGDYKFYYEMAQTQFFAAVRFPEGAALCNAQKKELAFILLEERGHIGSYSVASSKTVLERLQLKRALTQLTFPSSFSVADFSFTEETNALCERYEPDFLQLYMQWRKQAATFHPEEIADYIPRIGLRYLCYANPHLSELFLIEHLAEIDWEALQHNRPVLHRLSQPFKQYMLNALHTGGGELIGELQSDPEGFIEERASWPQEEEEEEEKPAYEHFTYERTLFEWPGAEHLVKGIPSLACQLYDAQQFKKRSNQQMDALFSTFNSQQIQLFSAIAELHWLHRYREWIDWSTVSRYNPHLNDDFLLELESYIVTEQLIYNTQCQVSESYLIEHMEQFKSFHPAPLVLSHLTARLFKLFQQDLKVNLDLLYDYYDYIDQHDFEVIFDLLSDS